MAIDKIQASSINLADTFAFTGTVSGTSDIVLIKTVTVSTSVSAVEFKNGVDGVYSDDPKTNPSATKYDTLSYDDIINKNLKIMDTSAIALCRDNSIPIAVFDFGRPGAIRDIIYGMEIGTLVQNQPTVV